MYLPLLFVPFLTLLCAVGLLQCPRDVLQAEQYIREKRGSWDAVWSSADETRVKGEVCYPFTSGEGGVKRGCR